MFAAKDLLFSRPTGYQLTRSLRFRASASAYLSRTLSTSGNRQIWTWSGWIKKTQVGVSTAQLIFQASDASTGTSSLNINYGGTAGVDTLCFNEQSGGSVTIVSSPIYRDPSAWYHIVCAYDTTQATAANRIKLYVNGSQITVTGSYPAQNTNGYINYSSFQHRICAYTGNSLYFDGYLAEINFIDGQQLTPSSFGQTDSVTGVWVPKKYSGTYGNNGFYLPFTNTSSDTDVAKDASGNGNNWTPNNISLGSASYTTYTTGSGTYTVPAGVTSINYLVVAGGGGGAGSYGGLVANGGGGGGGGGVVYGTLAVTPGQTISYSVGAGGSGSVNGSSAASNGSNSTFSTFTAIGGGRGGNQTGAAAATGGSGGGGAADSPNQTGAAGTSGQGYAGGNGTTSGAVRAGGGGGATANGATGLASGNGGAGFVWLNGTVYGGGGGGGAWSNQSGGGGAGGSGGGGAGGTSGDGTAGTSNTGGGGGGGGAPAGSSAATAGGNGGSGIVIVSYGYSTTYDSMIDVPYCTGQGAGTQPSGNYCVMNGVAAGQTGFSRATLSNGNLTQTGTAGSGNYSGIATIAIPTTGTWYWEFTCISTTGGSVWYGGIAADNANYSTGSGTIVYYAGNGNYYKDGTNQSTPVITYTTNDVIGFVCDITNNQVKFYKNGSLVYTASYTFSSSAKYFPYMEQGSGSVTQVTAFNFGQQPFAYSIPSGAKALCAANLPKSTIGQ